MTRVDIFAEIGNGALTRLVRRYAKHQAMNQADVCRAAVAWRLQHDGKPYPAALLAPVDALFSRWYASLQAGAPDFTVYADPFYVADIWTCWSKYSRGYVRRLSTAILNGTLGVNPTTVRRILDLGCGFGYTTAGFRQTFPHATVIGSNLLGTTQAKVATDVGVEYGFAVIGEDTFPTADLVLASEFFEHIEDPFDYLETVLARVHPRILAAASSFKPLAIGHFNRYRRNGQTLDGAATSRLFGRIMRANGYTAAKTKFWNNRPMVWVST